MSPPRLLTPTALSHLTPEQRAAVTKGAEVVLHGGSVVEVMRVRVSPTGVQMWVAEIPDPPPPPPH